MADIRQTPISQLPALTETVSTSSPVVVVQGGVTYRTTAGALIALAGGAYTDEQARDVVAAMFAAGTHSGVSFTYNDASDSMNVTVTGMTNPMTAAGDLIYGGASGAPTRLAAGADGKILKMVSGAPAWGDAPAGGGGGLTNFTESVVTSAPNATVPVARLAPNNAATNVDVAMVPKGDGAFILSVPDGTAAGGNKRGAGAVDLQMSRNAAGMVASGEYSFLAGYRNQASGTYSAAVGANNSSSAGYTFVAGGSNIVIGDYSASFGGSNTVTGTYSFACGQNNTVSGNYGFASGVSATTRGLYGVRVHASGSFGGVVGSAQRMSGVLRVSTSSATAATATLDGAAAGAANQLALPDWATYIVKATVVARHGSGDSAAWDVTFCIKRGGSASATAIVGTPTITNVGADAGASTWALAITADTTNGCPKFTVTGEAGRSLKWVVDVYSCAQVV